MGDTQRPFGTGHGRKNCLLKITSALWIHPFRTNVCQYLPCPKEVCSIDHTPGVSTMHVGIPWLCSVAFLQTTMGSSVRETAVVPEISHLTLLNFRKELLWMQDSEMTIQLFILGERGITAPGYMFHSPSPEFFLGCWRGGAHSIPVVLESTCLHVLAGLTASKGWLGMASNTWAVCSEPGGLPGISVHLSWFLLTCLSNKLSI